MLTTHERMFIIEKLRKASSDDLRAIVASLSNDGALTGHKMPTMLSMDTIYNTARVHQPDDIRNFTQKV